MQQLPPGLCCNQHCRWAFAARWGAQPQRVLSAHSSSKARRSFRREAPLAAWGSSALKRQTCDHSRHTCRSQSTDVEEASSSGPLAGEDAASFDPSQQSTAKWTFFTAELAVVLAIVYAVSWCSGYAHSAGQLSTHQYMSLTVLQIWISPDTGIATPLVHQLEAVFQNSHATMTLILLGFAAIHSGMAYLRPSGEVLAEIAREFVEPSVQACDAAHLAGEAAIGPRAYRVVFAAISLPLAVLAVVYFINHRYDGTALWNLRRAPYVHELVFALNFVSFYFLYPSTFNLLEVGSRSACQLPALHHVNPFLPQHV